VAGLATGGLGLMLCLRFFGPDFFTGLLAPRVYSLADGYRYAFLGLEPMQIPLLVCILGAILVRDRYARFFLMYLCVALPIGIIQAEPVAGVAINAVFRSAICRRRLALDIP